VCTSPLAVALFMSLVVHMLLALRHRHGCAADLLPAHTNTGSRPCPSWPNLCTRTHAHVRSFAGVCPQPTPPGRSSLSPCPCSLPSARHQFCVAAKAEPSVFGTHTYACNRGAEPPLHLSVTVLDIPSCRRREPQRTGARVSVEPSTPRSNLSATSTLNSASPRSAR
jgi:hypothetical protein